MLDSNGVAIYPWNHGETLTAAALNQAIAQNSGATVSAAVPPSNPTLGMLWYDPASGQLWVWSGSSWQPLYGTASQAVAGYPLMQAPQPAGGLTSSPYPFGTFNEATALSCNIWPPDASGRPTWPGVLGIWNANRLATYSSRDMCTFYAGANSLTPTTITVATATYTATTMVPATALTPTQVSFIQQAIAINAQRASMIPAGFDNVGMLIDTQHSTKYTGNITAVASDGSSVTVQGWFQMGNQSAGQVPPGGIGCLVNPCTHMWNINGICWLDGGSTCSSMTFMEGDVYNNQTPFNPGTSAGIPTIGVSMNGNSANTNGYAFIALNNWYTGFLSLGNQTFGFLIQPASQNPPYGFVSQVASSISGGHHPFAYWDSAQTPAVYRWSVGSSGGMNLGAPNIDNGFAIATNVSGSQPFIQAVGPDTNIDIRLIPKANGTVHVSGAVTVDQYLYTGNAVGTADAAIAIGEQRTGSGNAYLSLFGDNSGTYGLRVLRSGGANANSIINHQGTGQLSLNLTDATGTAQMFLQGNGATKLAVNAAGVGFQGYAPIARPTVSGSKGGNAALASLMTALVNYGLVTDTTT